MGLSSKQVSSDGLGWNQALLQSTQTLELPKANSLKRQNPQNQHQQQSEPPLKCPRCDSTNTKFCYYNNYNKSQPRYFCKACKRHWTKGGTLRNVPVGGGRKNKRLKTSNTNTAASATTAATITTTPARTSTINTAGVINNFMAIPPQKRQRQDLHQLPVVADDQKNMSNNDMGFQAALIHPPTSSLLHLDSSKSNNDNFFLQGSTLSLPLPLPQITQGLQIFPFSSSISSSSFDTTPSSISNSFQSSSIYNYSNGETIEDPTITSVSQPWQVPIRTGNMDMPNYWNWDEIDALVSTHDLNIMPWDDSQIKP